MFDYAYWLGMDPVKEEGLLWIAREALKAPLPEHWKPCRSPTNEIYYFNFQTGESVWEHPCDEYYKNLYQEEKKKLEERKAKPKPKKSPKKAGPDPGHQAQSRVSYEAPKKAGPLNPLAGGAGPSSEGPAKDPARAKAGFDTGPASHALGLDKPKAQGIAIGNLPQPGGAGAAAGSRAGEAEWRAKEDKTDEVRRKEYRRSLQEERQKWEGKMAADLKRDRERAASNHLNEVKMLKEKYERESALEKARMEREAKQGLKEFEDRLKAQSAAERKELQARHAKELAVVKQNLAEQIDAVEAEMEAQLLSLQKKKEGAAKDAEREVESLKAELASVKGGLSRDLEEAKSQAADIDRGAEYDAALEEVKAEARREAEAEKGKLLASEVEDARARAKAEAAGEYDRALKEALDKARTDARAEAAKKKERVLADELARVTEAAKGEAASRREEILAKLNAEQQAALDEQTKLHETARAGAKVEYDRLLDAEVDKLRAEAAEAAAARRSQLFEEALSEAKSEAMREAAERAPDVDLYAQEVTAQAELRKEEMLAVALAEVEAEVAVQKKRLLAAKMRDVEAELAQDVVPYQDGGGRVSKESSGSSTRISQQHGDSFIQQEVATTPLKAMSSQEVVDGVSLTSPRQRSLNASREDVGRPPVPPPNPMPTNVPVTKEAIGPAAPPRRHAPAPEEEDEEEEEVVVDDETAAGGDEPLGPEAHAEAAPAKKRRARKRHVKKLYAPVDDGVPFGECLKSLYELQKVGIKERKDNLKMTKSDYKLSLQTTLDDTELGQEERMQRMGMLNILRELIHAQAQRLNEDARQLKYTQTLHFAALENPDGVALRSYSIHEPSKARRVAPAPKASVYLANVDRSFSSNLLSNVTQVMHHIESRKNILAGHSGRLESIKQEVRKLQSPRAY